MTVYTVKQTGLTRAGPQKCASVNVVLEATMRVITAIIICMAVNVIGREIPPANCELRIM